MSLPFSDEDLILTVRRYPSLYDPQDEYYRNAEEKRQLWKEVGREVPVKEETGSSISPYLCRERWMKLRADFKRAHTLRNATEPGGRRAGKPIKYGRELSFLVLYLETPKRNSNRDAAEDDDVLVQNYFDEKFGAGGRDDSLQTFFASLGGIASQFPPKLQLRVKRDVFNVVVEADKRAKAKATR